MSRLAHKALLSLKWLVLAILVLVVVVILLVAGLLAALGSEPGTRWVMEQIPGLEVHGDRGSLLGTWQATSLRWQGYGVTAEVASPWVEWSPTCLFRRQLCLDALYAEQIDIAIQPGEDGGAGGPIDLPDLQLPLAVSIGDVRLGAMSINQAPVWTSAHLSAEGSGSDWQILDLYYQLDAIEVTAGGRVATRGDWPVAVDVDIQLPPPSGDQWNLDLNLGGSVADLRLRAASKGYLDAQLEGRLAPLQPDLPASLRLESARFLALDTLPQTLTLEQWTVNLQGDLDRGFRTRTQATLPGTTGPMALELVGTLLTTGVEGLRLDLREADVSDPAGRVQVAGSLDWQGGFDAEAEVEMVEFPWYGLLPDLEEPAVRLKALNASGRYGDSRYQADVSARVDGPMGSAELASQVEGDHSAVRLQRLTLTTGGGKAQGQASLDFAEQLAWQAGLTLEQFNPGYWVPLLEANLTGEISSSGRLAADQSLSADADWQLTGQWQSQPAQTRGKVQGSEGVWALSDFSLDVGENHVAGEGQWSQQLQANLSLDLPAPEVLLPGLGGNLNGTIQASGTMEQPQGQVRLEGSDLAWQDSLSLGALNIQATLADNLNLDADVVAESLSIAGQDIDRITAALTGNPDDHRLELTSSQKVLATRWQFDGRWADGWQGALQQGRIELPEQEQVWQLESPAAIEFRTDPLLTLGSHCWRWQRSTVCAEDQMLLPDMALAYSFNNFPTLALGPLFPDAFRWQSQLNGQVSIRLPDAGPDGQVVLNADAGAFEINTDGEWHSLDYDTFTTKLTLKPEQAALALTLAGPDIGRLDTQLAVDPNTSDYPLDGQFDLDGFDIAFLGAIADLDELAGTINGNGRIEGPLRSPKVYGAINLSNGQVVDERVPTPLEAVSLELTLNGQSADVAGRWQPHERSEGRIRGQIDWSGPPTVDLNVSGERLPFSYEPYASVELAPDITIHFADGSLKVSGELAVPRGEIRVRQLPEQAVSVSGDEVVVGVEAKQPALRSLTMDVTVLVGEDEVTFEGFGVDGELEGTLRLGNDLDTRGVLQLVDGTFEAYGQELELRRARLVFVGPITEPYLDIEAIRQVDEVTAGLRLSGPVSEPETEVFSTPSMSQSNALSYVILGRPLRSEGDEGQVGQAALGLGLTQASKVTQKIGDEIGIEQLVLETEGAGDDAAVVASGYLTEDLSVRYGVGIFDPVTTIALRYDLGRYYYLEAASGLAASLDLFYTRDF